MFDECKSLSVMPDISKWNFSKDGNMSNMFSFCLSLVTLPDISKWKVDNCYLMVQMFAGCISLSLITDISGLKTRFTRTYSMLQNFINLCDIPDINMIYDVRFGPPFYL